MNLQVDCPGGSRERIIGVVYVDGQDARLALIRAGLAWHFKRYAHEQAEEDRERYSFAEVEARAKRAGLWSDPEPVPPWEWRRLKR